MSTSIIAQLVKKDLLIMRKMILIIVIVNILLVTITALLFGKIPHWAFINLAFMLLIAPSVTCGVALIMKTIVMEKVKSTQLFIMSLPVTVKEFTAAKSLVNIPVFFVLWLLGSGASFYFAFGLDVFPHGTIPFISMIFLGILLAYTCIFSTSLLSQSHGLTILSMPVFSLGTSAYLWVIVYQESIMNHIYGSVSVWNSTAIGIVLTQILATGLVLCLTFYIQNRKRDFI